MYFVTPVEYFKILCICRHLHETLVCSAHTLITVIAMSNSKVYHMSILEQWTCIRLLCIRKRLPYSNNLRDCHHLSNKGVWWQTRVSHIKLLQLCTHMINILLLTKRKRMVHRQCSTKWDLQLTFPASYKVHTYVTTCILYYSTKHWREKTLLIRQSFIRQPFFHHDFVQALESEH